MKFERLKQTDPEFSERIDAFMNHEVVNEAEAKLDDRARYMAILSALIGCQGIDAYRDEIKNALKEKLVTPVEAKEIVYQSVDYLGIGRVYPFLDTTNEVMSELNISLPLPPQATTSMENRISRGEETQVKIFGDSMIGFSKGGYINRWLSGNCFGDYYTRAGLKLAEREMITFCYLSAQGGCETQLTGHALANMNLGNDKNYLLKIVAQTLPYIGYPRSLNAIACINKAAEAFEKKNQATES